MVSDGGRGTARKVVTVTDLPRGIGPAQGAHGSAPMPVVEAHDYLSTACHHAQHDYCGCDRTLHGDEKTPGRCKFCPAPCRCDCHRAALVAEAEALRGQVRLLEGSEDARLAIAEAEVERLTQENARQAADLDEAHKALLSRWNAAAERDVIEKAKAWRACVPDGLMYPASKRPERAAALVAAVDALTQPEATDG